MTYEMMYKLLITEKNVPSMVKLADTFKKSGEDEKIVNRALSVARKDKTRKKKAIPELNKTYFKSVPSKPVMSVQTVVEHMGEPTIQLVNGVLTL